MDREKDLTEYKKIVNFVLSEILFHKGNGFKIEIQPVFTKTIKYRSDSAFLNKNKKVWKLDRHMYIENKFPRIMKDQFNVELRPSVVKNLPVGIKIEKTSIQVLKDERKNYSAVPSATYAYYSEGRRVFLSVSDEYASKVYREQVYTDDGIPFSERLLNNNYELLKSIVDKHLSSLKYKSNAKEVNVEVDFGSVSAVIAYTHEEKKTVTIFEELGMQRLDTIGQVYEMTSALLEIIKKEFPEFSNNYTISMSTHSMMIDRSPRAIRIKFKQKDKQLLEW